MKIMKSQLRKIIKEEIAEIKNEINEEGVSGNALRKHLIAKGKEAGASGISSVEREVIANLITLVMASAEEGAINSGPAFAKLQRAAKALQDIVDDKDDKDGKDDEAAPAAEDPTPRDLTQEDPVP